MTSDADRGRQLSCISQIIIELRLETQLVETENDEENKTVIVTERPQSVTLTVTESPQSEENVTVTVTERPRLCVHHGGSVAECWPGEDCPDVSSHSSHLHTRQGQWLVFTDCCDTAGSCWTMFTRTCSTDMLQTSSQTRVKSISL